MCGRFLRPPLFEPPYDWALGPAESGRTEHTFLSHTYRWLKPGGVLKGKVQTAVAGRRHKDQTRKLPRRAQRRKDHFRPQP